MPGGWELRRNKSVLAAVLHTDVTTVAWAFGLKQLQIPGQIVALAGMPYDHARNVACMRTLECGADFCLFLDNDVIPPPDAITRLMAHDQPIISGMYSRRSPPHAVPVMLKNGTWITNFKKGSLIEVDLVGAGCLLLRRDFLQNFQPQRPGKHWFDWRVDLKGTGLVDEECMSEDFTLCLAAKRQGYRVLVDTSVECKHVVS